MPRKVLPGSLALSILLSVPLWISAQDSPPPATSPLQNAQLVSVEGHTEGRPFDWVARGAIPIYDRYPFHDLTLELNGMRYTVRYESQTGYYPAAWKPGNTIPVRVGHGRLYLLRYDGDEVPASLIRRERLHHR
jgi:hypothetical protein